MLNGIDPIIIFQFSKLADTSFATIVSKIPVVGELGDFINQPPIPIYLSETLTGIYIDSEDKNVDISTDTQTLADGSEAQQTQKGISSTVAINLVAKKNSLGMALLSAMIDLVFEKVSSKEYSITYLHGSTTIFRGLLSSYVVNQNASNDLLSVKIEITRGAKDPIKAATTPTVEKLSNVQVLGA